MISMEQSTRDHADIRLWLRLLYCTSRIEQQLQSKLTAEFGMSLARFDMLSQLERAPAGLTMTELSRQMMVSNGATTSLVDRLAEDGLLQRAPHPSDRRTTIISLTDAGRARFLEIAQEHEGWVIGLLDGLSSEAKAELLSGLGALKQHLSN
jgi:DNA-binding MarR family transcriptional regulator